MAGRRGTPVTTAQGVARVSVRRVVGTAFTIYRRRLALALVVATLPVLIEHQVVHTIEALVGLPFLALLVLNLAGIVLVMAPVTRCEVVLAYALTCRSIEPV
jgi:hypothetical protein